MPNKKQTKGLPKKCVTKSGNTAAPRKKSFKVKSIRIGHSRPTLAQKAENIPGTSAVRDLPLLLKDLRVSLPKIRVVEIMDEDSGSSSDSTNSSDSIPQPLPGAGFDYTGTLQL